ncbi:hypothetical protein EHI8A_043820 [Entamoeba histolytica HM-1:IMSS-B]|uniref:Thioredoxin n=5 Tax=Entamoeba histolytica TaxID=5759 RepID=C4MAK2_ENTH1|nr:hypothetical protein EHI_017000 [Entamoeba histolytica HM-1:IMSS]EMH77148.1 hypothetical protein EHI8A_043820 [Entamoeba histolytica HM-1:IMSS-B]EMS12300.1 hypothetical protein KM1_090230 [Entamoeba histolytica HM-3:IMSS]ENY63310.1 hypothetical protein EHI7A_044540 [Entamoeba histolytica HM-1:IMSS-A]BAN39318.1 hypothetical protein [Entamoeba histolytica]EAL45851.1 hypothetical protein EHI_017000 [Entamoeba histolytica HM-1:IMSS]|eukprot:XP_651237.1 hypothetical protein EHI_017000 [Entamoeba histolytica HM-1:IMSS]
MLFLLFVTLCFGQHVANIAPADVENFINEQKFTFLCFTDPKDSKMLTKKMEKMSSSFEEVTFGIYNASLDGEVETKYAISSLPSFILQRPGYQKRFYYDSWSSDTIFEFLKEGTSPVAEHISFEKGQELLKEETAKEEKGKKKGKKIHPFFLLVAKSETDKEIINKYIATADELKLSVEDHFYITEGDLALYHRNKDGIMTWDKKFELDWWMNVVIFPVFSKLNDAMTDMLDFNHQLPIFWYFSAKHNQTEHDTIKRLAEEYRLKMLFIQVDGKDIELGLYGQTSAPSATILHANGRTMYPLKSLDNISEDITNYFNNKLNPLIRSSKDKTVIPEVQAEQLLRSEFDDVVKKTKDLVIFVIDSSPFTLSVLKRDIAAFLNRTHEVTAFKPYWMNSDTDDVPVEIQFTNVPAVLVHTNGAWNTMDTYPSQKGIMDFVSQFFKFEALPEIPESQLPPLEEEDEDDEDIEDDIDEELEEEDERKPKIELTVEQVKELLKDKFVLSTLEEINWKKLFKVGKGFSIDDDKSIKKLMGDDTFMSLITPFYQELHSVKRSVKPKHQRDEL